MPTLLNATDCRGGFGCTVQWTHSYQPCCNRIQVVYQTPSLLNATDCIRQGDMTCLLNATTCNRFLPLVHSVAFSRVRVNQNHDMAYMYMYMYMYVINRAIWLMSQIISSQILKNWFLVKQILTFKTLLSTSSVQHFHFHGPVNFYK